MRGTIDRFEEDYVVIELDNKEMINIHKSKIPREAKEGDVLKIEDKITVDFIETKNRKDAIEKLVKDIWEN
ncbi:DUF3006 domain-containing protein [Clostridium rectalis]|uniref:DUF3006 domain-containing protein n=1 Tax=Clostridium rectalis TaxID=2040295 RepID=UPI000F62FC02|nr:DUF3006 domain-containing protein [Clostridium rectalis]